MVFSTSVEPPLFKLLVLIANLNNNHRIIIMYIHKIHKYMLMKVYYTHVHIYIVLRQQKAVTYI